MKSNRKSIAHANSAERNEQFENIAHLRESYAGQGQPLDSYETIVKYIRSTKTTTGLRVRARLVKKTYEKGIKISKAQFEALSIKRHDTLPQWNYTLSPR